MEKGSGRESLKKYMQRKGRVGSITHLVPSLVVFVLEHPKWV
jgi:hypothetical protein